MEAGLWWVIALCVVLSLALCYGLWWVIVKWIMSDAPPNTRFAGINNYTRNNEGDTPPPGSHQ